MPSFDAEKIRADFPILDTSNGKRLVYLDSAATSQKPKAVIDAVSGYYRTYNANIHRGMYDISIKATEAYMESKRAVAGLINAESYKNILYCRNTTEAINIVALSWAGKNVGKGDTILLTEMEHHSNIVPWQMLAMKKGAVLEYVRLKKDFSLDMDDYKEKLEHGPKIVSFAHVSNVLGVINDAKEMARLAHKNGAVVLLDAAQSVPHMAVDVRSIGCDFLAFSGHKMLGPAGIGVLYGRERLFEEMEPVLGGGDMIRSVRFDSFTWNELPWKFEAGTQNIEGGIGLGEAVRYIGRIGIGDIREHENSLLGYALERFGSLRGIRLYLPALDKRRRTSRAGIIPFNVEGVHAHDVSAVFDAEGIAIRSGHHCAMPLVNKVMHEDSVARISLYLYNTEEDIERAASAMEKVGSLFKK